MSLPRKRFTSYFEDGELPVSGIDVRFPTGSRAVLALANHGPAPGLHFQPVDDFIVSLVHRSSHAEVVRDIGQGPQILADAPGRIFVTPARTHSYWSFSGTPTVLHIALPWREVTGILGLSEDDLMLRMHAIARTPFEDPMLNMIAWRLWAVCEAEGQGGALFAEHALRVVLATLLLRSSGNQPTKTLAHWQVCKAQNFMRSHLDRSLRLVDIAESAGLSQYHFLRAYKNSTGLTPFQWLAQQRVERAKELMLEPECQLVEVALATGFSSQGHFSTTFRRITGLTPTGWQREFTDRKA
ncbi:MAG TPA: AraC family transcriptional regulator [Woeseiaceae bacterium]|nr:AraC family transcriptional regulator [Woeseiaceae bacterium]